MCQWALISWPVDNKRPDSLYLILGEIKPENKDDVSRLSKLHKNLTCLYPFLFTVKDNSISNVEDIYCFQKNFDLTEKIQLCGKLEKGWEIFRRPVLYDISCMKRLFRLKKPIKYEKRTDKICIVVSNPDPIKRGFLLEQAVSSGYKNFVLLGGIHGKNKEKISSLTRRYLLQCKVPMDNIVICDENNSILDVLEVINIMFVDRVEDIVVACNQDNIQRIGRAIYSWKKLEVIDKSVKISYLCDF